MYTKIAIEAIAISEIILAAFWTPRQGPHPGPRASLHAYRTPGSSWALGRTCVRCGPHGQEMQSYVSVCLFRSTFTTRYSTVKDSPYVLIKKKKSTQNISHIII